eukprot:1728835-Pyramimonas_sp.AAC.2
MLRGAVWMLGGYSVDVKGCSVDVKGFSVDGKGFSVDVKGCSGGTCVEFCGAPLASDPVWILRGALWM